MLLAHDSVHVAATPREVLEFVCDLRAYMLLDPKIANVYECSPVDADGNGHAVIRGSLRGIRSRLRVLRRQRLRQSTPPPRMYFVHKDSRKLNKLRG